MILVFLALVGATLIVVRSTLFAPFRWVFPSLLECSQCTGTWIGFLAGASRLVQTGHSRIIDTVIVGFATSLLSLLADAVLLRLIGDPSEVAPPADP